MTDKLPKK